MAKHTILTLLLSDSVFNPLFTRPRCSPQSTYEYGKQLLQAALVLRRSLHHDLKPNHERAMRLLDVWKKFSQGVNERASRLNGIAVFHKNADSVCCVYETAHRLSVNDQLWTGLIVALICNYLFK